MLSCRWLSVYAVLLGSYTAFGQSFSSEIFIGVGGGHQSSPSSSAHVLERNQDLFRESAIGAGVKDAGIVRLFGSGGETDDVFERRYSPKLSEKISASLLGGSACPECLYRRNRLENLAGPASLAAFSQTIDESASLLDDQGRLRLFFSGHGSPHGDEDDYDHNNIVLWDGYYSVQEFADDLKKVDDKVNVQVVMTQCYSGGFAQMVFEGADPAEKPTTASQCGFFSQVKDRVASGCSADINFRKEYSPFFFAALNGHKENGDSVYADFDMDGSVTAIEAHAYVVAHEDSFDNPVTTSSEFLRYRSDEFDFEPLSEDFDLKASFTPAEKYVYEELNHENLPARRLSARVAMEKAKRIQKSGKKKFAELKRAQIENSSETELSSQVFSKKLELLAEEKDFQEMVKSKESSEEKQAYIGQKIEEMESYKAYNTYYERAFSLEEKMLAAQHKIATGERLEYLIQSKTLEYKAKKNASAETQEKYKQLQDCESARFF